MLNIYHEAYNVPRSVLIHMQYDSVHELVRIAEAARDGVCTACGATRHDTMRAFAQGGVACCPDCSTLSVVDRNTLRELLDARCRVAEPGVG